MISSEIAAAAAAAQAAQLMIQAFQWVYIRMTEPQPLSDREDGNGRFIDKTRYERLCRYRLNLIDKEKIPDAWKLENDCPIYRVSFGETAKRLKDLVENLNSSTYPQQPQVLGMLERILSLFEHLKKKNAKWQDKVVETSKELFLDYKGYRSDGFEAMFFSDLALWLSISLPSMPIYEQKTIDMVGNWKKYCDLVLGNVIISRGDKGSAQNPRRILKGIILDLDVLKKDMEKAKKSADFNMKVQSVESAMSRLIRNTFNFSYSLIKYAPHESLQVRSLLEQDEKNKTGSKTGIDSSIQKVFQCLMGQWLVKTLRTGGIESNNFINLKMIDLTEISRFLSSDINEIPIELNDIF